MAISLAIGFLQAVALGVLSAIWAEIKHVRRRLHEVENWKASQVLLLDQVRRYMERDVDSKFHGKQ